MDIGLFNDNEDSTLYMLHKAHGDMNLWYLGHVKDFPFRWIVDVDNDDAIDEFMNTYTRTKYGRRPTPVWTKESQRLFQELIPDVIFDTQFAEFPPNSKRSIGLSGAAVMAMFEDGYCEIWFTVSAEYDHKNLYKVVRMFRLPQENADIMDRLYALKSLQNNAIDMPNSRGADFKIPECLQN